MVAEKTKTVTARVFNVQRFSVQDGPGIRSTVFLKGCPLRCLWCANPESQKGLPEIGHLDMRCDQCGRCVEACLQKAIALTETGGVKINREACDACGECVKVCLPGALRIFGQETTVDEVFQEILRDKVYYDISGGGVTCGGGEPLEQADFVAALFQRCREHHIHTTLDTCGYAPLSQLEKVLHYTDLILFDIKHMDPVVHQRVTGVSNELILENARIIARRGVPMIIRIPVIPGVNMSEEDIGAIATFIKGLDHVTKVDLFPYHRFGVGKYKMLDLPYELDGIPTVEDSDVEPLKHLVESFGLDCGVGG